VSDRARPRRNRAPLVLGALIAAVALAGCSSGQITQTSSQVAAVEGANAGAGQIAVRNAMIEFEEPAHGAAIYPAGSDAPLQMTIVNSGAEVDRLVAASSPVAASVQINGVLRIPGGQALTIQGAAAPAAAPAPAEAGPPATPEPSAAEPSPAEPPSTETPATALPTEPVAAPPVDEGQPGVGNIVLTGLREDVQAGRTYPLVLTFERAGEVRFDIPVANPDTLREDEHA
jgi:copper(I)-binding protein